MLIMSFSYLDFADFDEACANINPRYVFFSRLVYALGTGVGADAGDGAAGVVTGWMQTPVLPPVLQIVLESMLTRTELLADV